MADNQDFTQDYTDANGEFQSDSSKAQFDSQSGMANVFDPNQTDANNLYDGPRSDNHFDNAQGPEAMEQGDHENSGMGDGENGLGKGKDVLSSEGPMDSGSAEMPGKDDERKLFVGGLSWETTEKDLRDHFGQYGEIESVNVKTDPNTGRSRGFAFVVFKSVEAIDSVINVADHLINGKKVDPKKAKAKQGKIFVGGLSPELTDDEIRDHFAQFGTIVEVEMPFDKQKSQRKGFCFITFESEAVVTELLKNPKQAISGKEVDVKKATPKQDTGILVRGGRGGARGAPRGRGGRGRGGWGQGWGGSGYGNYPYNNYGYGGYDYGYGGGYGGYGGYDYYGNYNYGYGGYDGGYGYEQGGYGGRGGATGRGKPQGNFGGKSRGGRQAQRHQPY